MELTSAGEHGRSDRQLQEPDIQSSLKQNREWLQEFESGGPPPWLGDGGANDTLTFPL